MTHYVDLRERGVTIIQRETFKAAPMLGREVLHELGFGAYQARQAAAEFMTTAIGQQLAAILAHQGARKGLAGWLKDVSANLSVNVLTILLIAALVFGYRLLDNWLHHLSSETGVSSTELADQTALAAWAGDPAVVPAADARRPATPSRLACEHA